MEIAGERSSGTSAAIIMQHHPCQWGQNRGFATTYGHKQYRPTAQVVWGPRAGGLCSEGCALRWLSASGLAEVTSGCRALV